MNFTCLLLSCCLASLPETITFFYFTLIFQEENLPPGNVKHLGFLTLRHRGCRTLANTRTPRPPRGALGRGLLRPLTTVPLRYEPRETQSVQQPTGKQQLLLLPPRPCTWPGFQSRKEHVGTERAETREPLGMSLWGLWLTTSPDMDLGEHLSAMGSKMHSTSTCSYWFASRTRKG